MNPRRTRQYHTRRQLSCFHALARSRQLSAPEPEAMLFTKISINVTMEQGEVVTSLALEQTDSRPTGQAMTHEDKLDVVRQQFDLHSDFGDISRAELKQHVADELNTSQRNANRFIKDLIDRKVFKVDGRSIVTGDNYE